MSRVYKLQLIVVYSKIGNRFFLSDSSHSSPPPLFLLVARQCDLPRPKLKFESQEYIIHVFDYIKDCYFEIFHRRVNCSILSATTHFLTQALHKRLNLLRLSYSFLLPILAQTRQISLVAKFPNHLEEFLDLICKVNPFRRITIGHGS